MHESNLFLSSCSRREWARRRSARSRTVVPPLLIPGLLALSCVLAAIVILLAIGHGTL